MDPKRLGNAMLGLNDYTTADVLNQPIRRGAILPWTEYADRSEFDLTSGLPGAFWNALMAPARAYRGEISEDQQIPEAFNFAGSLTLGSLLAPRPTGSVGMGGRAKALDMSDAARMARAKEMGFDTDKAWYHGTKRGNRIDEFDLGRSGEATGTSLPGVWFTNSWNEADLYGRMAAGANRDLGAVHRYKAGVGEYYLPKNVKVIDLAQEIKKIRKDHGFGEDASFSSIMGDMSDWAQSYISDAQKEGFSGVRFVGIEDGPLQGYGHKLGPTTHTVVFDPADIRSVNAAFDPSQAGSANLLAANAKTGAAVPLATRALEAQQPQGIRAFHGSPYDFDRFDMSKIGTGEGAQAYGHGLYFAENEKVAKQYRDELGGFNWDFGGGKNIPDGISQGVEFEIRQALDRSMGDLEYAKRFLQNELDRWGNDANPDTARALSVLESTPAKANPSGHMYEVRINADPADFLDWNKPLSQQSEKAREAALSAMERASGITRNDLKEGVTGADAVRYGGLDDPNAMTNALREAGIPGIRYLDQMSRGAGEGSSNYVVFDDALIEIMRKYGLLGPVAAGTVAAATNDEGPIY